MVLFRVGCPQKPALFINKPLAPFRGATSDSAVESEVEVLSEICRELGIVVERRDFVTGREKEELFRTHDLLIFSSHWESFGLVVIEAMAWGLPVVATASDGVIGILGVDYPHLAPVKDFEELAKVLSRVLQMGIESDYGRKMFLDFYQAESRELALLKSITEISSPQA